MKVEAGHAGLNNRGDCPGPEIVIEKEKLWLEREDERDEKNLHG